MRLVPKNLRNYLQTPTLIGCRFLTNPEATYRLLRLALLRSAKPCSLAQFLKNCQTFFASHFFFPAPRNLCHRTLKPFSEAFDYALFFQTASTSKEVFFDFHLLAAAPLGLLLEALCSVVSRAHEYMPISRHCKTAANKIEAVAFASGGSASRRPRMQRRLLR